MTPQEKAQELVFKFYPHVKWKMGQQDVKERAKECALICCNEILGHMGSDRGYRFWTEVKLEIETL